MRLVTFFIEKQLDFLVLNYYFHYFLSIFIILKGIITCRNLLLKMGFQIKYFTFVLLVGVLLSDFIEVIFKKSAREFATVNIQSLFESVQRVQIVTHKLWKVVPFYEISASLVDLLNSLNPILDLLSFCI